MEAVVIGNAALDVLCYPVDDVPRLASLGIERTSVGAGGCGSNTAIGLAMLGVDTAFVTCVGTDETAGLLETAWERAGIDCRYVRREQGLQTGLSVGLVDSQKQPRFIHYAGASAGITSSVLDLDDFISRGVRWIHTSGYFILPGLLNAGYPAFLRDARGRGVVTSMDVVESPQMDDPGCLWECLPHLDVFMCNLMEAEHLTGETDPWAAGRAFARRGARTVVLKMGGQGCMALSREFTGQVPSEAVVSVDTTGAGDAFAAGFMAASLNGRGIEQACRAGNAAGRRMVTSFGAVAGWFHEPDDQKGQ